MKKRMLIAGAALACCTMIGCGTTAAVTQAQPQSQVVRPETQLINWQGAELGAGVPEWVLAVSAREYENLPEAKEKTLLALSGDGSDRDLLKVWVETQDASSELSKRLSETVTAEAGSALKENVDSSAAQQSKTKIANQVVGLISQNRFSGFSRLRTFWTQSRNTVDNKTEYHMYALYGIDKQLLSKQIADVMNQVKPENPEEQAALADINRLVQASAMKSGAVMPVEVR